MALSLQVPLLTPLRNGSALEKSLLSVTAGGGLCAALTPAKLRLDHARVSSRGCLELIRAFFHISPACPLVLVTASPIISQKVQKAA